MDEHELIEYLGRAFDGGRGTGVELGIGDDAAVVSFEGYRAVITTDALHEGTHFERDWIEPAALAERAIEVNLSDLAAMGAAPHSLLLALAMRAPMDGAMARALIDGFAGRARVHGCAVIGGNVSRADALSLTVTAIGALSPELPAVRRDGARPGDLLFVSGPLGGAALGVRLLLSGKADHVLAGPALERYRAPRARVALGRALPRLATAAIDVSDGLARDLGHLATASGAGASVELERVPTIEGHDALATLLGLAPFDVILGGGEDYELLFAIPPEHRDRAAALGAVEIGRVESGAGIRFFSGGSPVSTPAGGFEHF